MKLTKDLTLKSGRVLKKGTEITTEKKENITQVTKQFFNQLQEEGYFSKSKKNNNLNQ